MLAKKFLILAALFILISKGYASPYFMSELLSVEATAENTLSAQEKALGEGEIQAWQQLMETLTDKKEVTRILLERQQAETFISYPDAPSQEQYTPFDSFLEYSTALELPEFYGSFSEEEENLSEDTLLSEEDYLYTINLLDLSAEERSSMLQSFSIQQEQRALGFYRAQIRYNFNPERVAQFLRSKAIPFVQIPAPTMLLLPIIKEENTLSLWETSWMEILQNTPPEPTPFLQMIVPEGNNIDKAIIPEASYIFYDNRDEIVENFKNRYNTQAILIILMEKESPLSFQVAAYSFGTSDPFYLEYYETFPHENKTDEEFWLYVQQTLIARMDAAWKQHALSLGQSSSTVGSTPDSPVTETEPTAIDAFVLIQNLQQWVNVRKRIESIRGIDKVEIITLSRERVHFKLWHSLTYSGLKNAMERSLLSVDDSSQEGHWYIMPQSP